MRAARLLLPLDDGAVPIPLEADVMQGVIGEAVKTLYLSPMADPRNQVGNMVTNFDC